MPTPNDDDHYHHYYYFIRNKREKLLFNHILSLRLLDDLGKKFKIMKFSPIIETNLHIIIMMMMMVIE